MLTTPTPPGKSCPFSIGLTQLRSTAWKGLRRPGDGIRRGKTEYYSTLAYTPFSRGHANGWSMWPAPKSRTYLLLITCVWALHFPSIGFGLDPSAPGHWSLHSVKDLTETNAVDPSNVNYLLYRNSRDLGRYSVFCLADSRAESALDLWSHGNVKSSMYRIRPRSTVDGLMCSTSMGDSLLQLDRNPMYWLMEVRSPLISTVFRCQASP